MEMHKVVYWSSGQTEIVFAGAVEPREYIFQPSDSKESISRSASLMRISPDYPSLGLIGVTNHSHPIPRDRVASSPPTCV